MCMAECPDCGLFCTSKYCACTRFGVSYTADPTALTRYEMEQCPDCTMTCITSKFACVPHECGDYEEHLTIPAGVSGMQPGTIQFGCIPKKPISRRQC